MESRVKRFNQEIDISNILPEPVFSNIISWLPVKEAVRTSVLVKRWKHAWKYVARLDLDPEEICEPNVEHVGSDSKSGKKLTPTRHSRADLIRCTSLYTSIIQAVQDEVTHYRIVHFPVNLHRGGLKRWINEILRKKNVKALSLECYETSISDRVDNVKKLELRPGIFSPLDCLELKRYRLFKTSAFQNCEKLRILKLSSLELGKDSLTEIFSSCKSLEELSMIDCSGFSGLEITSQNLKFLELQCLELNKINIFAEALTTLILCEITCRWSSVVIEAPRVTELQAYCSVEGAFQIYRERHLSQENLLERCTGFLSCHDCSHPLYSSRMGYVSAFSNLQVLSTSLDLNDIRHAILMSYIFRVCLQLKRLDITVEVRDPCKLGTLYYPEHMFWEQKEVSYCVSNCLRAVSVQNFKGEVLELEFVKYIITRAPKMHRVTVKCADDCTTEGVTATQSLLSFPKCSMEVSVVILPPTPTAGALALPLRRRRH